MNKLEQAKLDPLASIFVRETKNDVLQFATKGAKIPIMLWSQIMLFVLNACFLFVHHIVFVSVCPPLVVRMKLIKKKRSVENG